MMSNDSLGEFELGTPVEDFPFDGIEQGGWHQG
jgi:hypothetical protein